MPEEIFGVATITIGEGEDLIEFNGKDYLQAEGGELSITPIFAEFQYADTGDTTVKRKVTGYEGTLTIVAGQEDAKILELAMGVSEKITDSGTSEVTGEMDAKYGTDLVGRKVNIHPRQLPAENKEFDYTIYNMASIEGMTRSYGSEQGSISITLSMMPRDGYDFSQPGNFWYRGATDPNA